MLLPCVRHWRVSSNAYTGTLYLTQFISLLFLFLPQNIKYNCVFRIIRNKIKQLGTFEKTYKRGNRFNNSNIIKSRAPKFITKNISTF